MPDVCSFLSGKSLEEALSIQYEQENPGRKIPDFNDLIEWSRADILDPEHAGFAHEVREKRNDYGHAFLKIPKEKLKKSPNRRPFTDEEALDIYQKAMKVLTYMYKTGEQSN
jgi:hypothetical protein